MDSTPSGLPRLRGDLRVMLLLLGEGRYRLLHTLFGISRSESNVVTLILLWSGLSSLHRHLDGAVAPLSRNARSDLWLGAATVRELLDEIAGPSARSTPITEELLLMAAGAAGIRAVAHLLMGHRPARQAARHARAAIRHRYGHLVNLRRPTGTWGPA